MTLTSQSMAVASVSFPMCTAWNTHWHTDFLMPYSSVMVDVNASSSSSINPLLTTYITPSSSSDYHFTLSSNVNVTFNDSIIVDERVEVEPPTAHELCQRHAMSMVNSNGSSEMVRGLLLHCVRTDIALTIISNETLTRVDMTYLDDAPEPVMADPDCGTASLRVKANHRIYSFDFNATADLPGNHLCFDAAVFTPSEVGSVNISDEYEFSENVTLYAACLLVKGN